MQRENIPSEILVSTDFARDWRNCWPICVYICRLHQWADTSDFYEDDYIRNQLLDKLWTTYARRFWKRKKTVTLGELLHVARSKKQFIDNWNNTVPTKQITRLMQGVASWMETRIPGRKRCALAVYRKDSSVKTKSALCVVRLAGNVVKQAISKLNALNSMGLILDQGH